MPEPNLPPLILYDSISIPESVNPQQVVNIDWIQERLPELPAASRDRLVGQYGILPEHSHTLVNEYGLMEYFESVVTLTQMDPKKVVGWILKDLLGCLRLQNLTISQSLISPSTLAELLDLVEKGKISSTIAKQVFQELWKNEGKFPAQIVQEKNLGLITDRKQLENIIQEVIDGHQEEVIEIRKGHKKVLNKLIGLVQRATKGQSDPVQVKAMLEDKLS